MDDTSGNLVDCQLCWREPLSSERGRGEAGGVSSSVCPPHTECPFPPLLLESTHPALSYLNQGGELGQSVPISEF